MTTEQPNELEDTDYLEGLEEVREERDSLRAALTDIEATSVQIAGLLRLIADKARTALSVKS